MKQYPYVSLIMPCFNEEDKIEDCLLSLLSNEYPKNKIEILVIDGNSTDSSIKKIKKCQQKYQIIKLLTNEKRSQTIGTNIGIKTAVGKYVIRVDAHCLYPKNYISSLINSIIETNVDCVGGIIQTKASKSSRIAKAISFSLAHFFGVGKSEFRIGIKKRQHVSTVPFGCYAKKVFSEIGYFNENLDRTDDLEFNKRLQNNGGKILLLPNVRTVYFSRENYKQLFKQNFLNGFWVFYTQKYCKNFFSFKHAVPFFSLFFFLLILVISLKTAIFLFFFYLIMGLFFSISISFEKKFRSFYLIAYSFFILHFSYALGSLCAIVFLYVPGMNFFKNKFKSFFRIN
jgi:glycosyltransferase involved in cell wall biosynthesis